MSNNVDNPNKGNESEKKRESTEKTIVELRQELAQRRAQQKHEKRIRQLKSGEAEVKDLDVIPFFCPNEWESRDQYEELVADEVDFPV